MPATQRACGSGAVVVTAALLDGAVLLAGAGLVEAGLVEVGLVEAGPVKVGLVGAGCGSGAGATVLEQLVSSSSAVVASADTDTPPDHRGRGVLERVRLRR